MHGWVMGFLVIEDDVMDLFLREAAADRIGADDVLRKIDRLMNWQSFYRSEAWFEANGDRTSGLRSSGCSNAC